MLNKDKLWVGVVIGTLVPIVIYAIFYLGMEMANNYVTSHISEKMQLVLIAINAILMRQFLIKREQDHIGRGILLVTFIGVILHFMKYYSDIL